MGAVFLTFRALPGFRLLFHDAENLVIKNHYACYLCYSRPPVACFLCNGSLEDCSFWIALVIFQDNGRIVFEFYPCPVGPSVFFSLPHYDRKYDLLSHVGPSPLDCCLHP